MMSRKVKNRVAMDQLSTNLGRPPDAQPTRSLEQARDWFRSEGISVRDWAARQGFDPGEVYAFLNGRTKGYRGNSHRVAVALRVKPAPTSIPMGGSEALTNLKEAARLA